MTVAFFVPSTLLIFFGMVLDNGYQTILLPRAEADC
jgi:hypothetical protein